MSAFGCLFGQNIKLYLYPTIDENGEIIHLKNFQPEAHLNGLFQYLVENKKLAEIQHYDEKLMNIRTDKVLEMIQSGGDEWTPLVPKSVTKMIKENSLFGYKA
jgi:nicotinic acid mononucleotide adenylyltransferase